MWNLVGRRASFCTVSVSKLKDKYLTDRGFRDYWGVGAVERLRLVWVSTDQWAEFDGLNGLLLLLFPCAAVLHVLLAAEQTLAVPGTLYKLC